MGRNRMQTHEETLTLLDHKIYTYSARPEGKIRANVLLVHGLGEHCRRYDHVIEAMTRAGIAVTAFDHIGHGRSSGKRGVYRYATAWELMKMIRDRIIAESPETPLFLYGHSLGGALVLTYAQRFPEHLRGVVSTSPGLGTVPEFSKAYVALMSLLTKIIPSKTVNNGLPDENLYRSESKTKTDDPLRHSEISLGLGYDLVTLGRDMVQRPDPFPLPLLLLQGGADRCVDASYTRRFAEKPGNESVDFKFYPDGYHELHNEPFKDEVIQLIIDWILDHSTGK